MRIATVLVLLASGPAIAERRDDDAAVRAQLIAAIQRRDVDDVKRRVKLPLEARDIVFMDAKCAADFTGSYTMIEEHELAAFVACLASIGVQPTAPMEGDATYGPGAILYAPVRDGRVVGLLSTGVKDDDGALFPIEPAAFASHMKRFNRVIVPSAALKKTIDGSADGQVMASVFVCIDERGKKIDDVKVEVEGDAAYERDVRAAARAWSFQPFKVGRQAVSACATLRVGYPEARLTLRRDPDLVPRLSSFEKPEPEPPGLRHPPRNLTPPTVTPSSAPRPVPPATLESQRIRGEKVILPDDPTKQAIRDAGVKKVVGSFKLCLDAAGAVTRVETLKTTGFESYDRTLIRGMRQWAYRPYLVDDKPVPVCTAITFIYEGILVK